MVENKGLKEKQASAIQEELNGLLQNYLDITINIKNLLNTNEDNEESIFKVLDILEKREEIIKRYNILKEENNKRRSLLDPGQERIVAELELKGLNLIQEIGSIDSEIMYKLNRLSISNQNHMKKINEGKRMFNAYDGSHPQAYGIFIDKKK